MSNDEPMKIAGVPIQWGKTEAALTKGAIGLLPLGSVFAELLTVFIPLQRKERIEKYIHALGIALDKMSEDQFKYKMQQAQYIDLFEDGGIQAAWALSDLRIDYIAKAVSIGITGDEVAAIRAKKVLQILAEIDDIQIIILARFLRKNAHDDCFFEKHKAVFDLPSAFIGAPWADLSVNAVHEVSKEQLERLGLFHMQYRIPRQNERLRFDAETGTLKEKSTSLSIMARILLHHIGLAEEGEM